jgi:outer membrane lipoprotein-sorting protein
MKKTFSILAGLILVTSLNAQTLEEIVKKFSEANKYDKLSTMSTIKISAKMSMMGMEIPVEMWMKNPDKVKTVTNFSGQEIISVFDGTKGYLVNPMSGSTTPVEMSAAEMKQAQANNIFKNTLESYLKEGKLTLEGEATVNDKPAFKLIASLDGGNKSTMFIDKSSYLLTKTTTTITQGGVPVSIDSYPSDYKEIDGILIPMKTTSSTQMGDMVITFDKVELNVPMDESVFQIKK